MSGVAVAVAGISLVGGQLASRRSANAAKDASAGANRLADTQAGIAQEQWDTYKSDYRPLEQSMLREAQAYDSPERQEQMAGMASADMGAKFGQAAAGLGRRLAGYGVGDPSGGQFAGQYRALAGQGAAAQAGAANMARIGVQDAGWGRRLQMANIGRGMAGTASSAAGSAANTMMNLASMNNSAANQAAAGAGQFIGAIGQGIKNYNNPTTFTAPGQIAPIGSGPGFLPFDPNVTIGARPDSGYEFGGG
jgi:hypothetical protein